MADATNLDLMIRVSDKGDVTTFPERNYVAFEHMPDHIQRACAALRVAAKAIAPRLPTMEKPAYTGAIDGIGTVTRYSSKTYETYWLDETACKEAYS